MITKKIGVAIVAPGGYAPDIAALPRAIAQLEARGCVVHNYYDHAALHQRFGATDEGRLAQLHAAIADPDVQIILALRGAYGMTRLLDKIDYRALANSGKIVVGYSDITALHMALYAKTYASSYAGPMAAMDFGAEVPDAFTMENFWACLAGPEHTLTGVGAGNPACDVRGTVWGGNLAMTVSLLGTPYFPDIDRGILFFEDIGEHPYRVERMLLQLAQAGVLARQKALVLGDFSGYRLGPADSGYNFDAMLSYLRDVLDMPVLTGLAFGHIARHVTIPFGANGRLLSTIDRFSLTLSDYPTITLA
ncbi:MAG: muramoyltetrapeptide carboxypeptidase [Pseudomonadota bacterium]|nr:muramoyltetrapeptide carboxypeptidase [Pseudomonadota bacterium]